MQWLFSFVTLVIVLNSPAVHAVTELYPYPKRKRVMINSRVLAQCMAGYINKIGMKFSLEPKRLYPNSFRRNGYRDTCSFSRSGFFLYLRIHPYRVCDFETGKEQQLRQWIIDQPDNSIDPLSLFKQALVFNGGHAFDALLSMHQLLRNEARWFSKKYYIYDSSEEKANKFWAKFVDIRGDLAEIGDGSEGDHRGSWYRFWGIMMYRLTLTEMDRVKETGESCMRSEPGFLSRTLADLQSSSIALAAELTKYVFDVHDDSYKAGGDRAGKARINSAGSQVASYLTNAIDNEQALDPDSPECSRNKFLLDPLF